MEAVNVPHHSWLSFKKGNNNKKSLPDDHCFTVFSHNKHMALALLKQRPPLPFFPGSVQGCSINSLFVSSRGEPPPQKWNPWNANVALPRTATLLQIFKHALWSSLKTRSKQVKIRCDGVMWYVVFPSPNLARDTSRHVILPITITLKNLIWYGKIRLFLCCHLKYTVGILI